MVKQIILDTGIEMLGVVKNEPKECSRCRELNFVHSQAREYFSLSSSGKKVSFTLSQCMICYDIRSINIIVSKHVARKKYPCLTFFECDESVTRHDEAWGGFFSVCRCEYFNAMCMARQLLKFSDFSLAWPEHNKVWRGFFQCDGAHILFLHM